MNELIKAYKEEMRQLHIASMVQLMRYRVSGWNSYTRLYDDDFNAYSIIFHNPRVTYPDGSLYEIDDVTIKAMFDRSHEHQPIDRP